MKRWDHAGTTLAVVVVLWNLAVAQPILDLLGRNAEFFVARRSPAIDVLLFAGALTLFIPIAVAMVPIVIGAVHRTTGTVVRALVTAGLAGLLALRVFRIALDASVWLTFVVATCVGIAVAVMLERSEPARLWVRYLLPLPLIFLGLFLALSEASDVVFQRSVGANEEAVVEEPAPVVMLVFDEFPTASLLRPDGSIDREAFPNFARLADTSSWYRNTVAVNGWTPLALPAILDGNEPRKGTLPVAADHPENLFTVLGSSYDVDAIQPITELCPTSICDPPPLPSARSRLRSLADDVLMVYRHQIYPRDLRRRLPRIDQAWGGFDEQPGVEPSGPDFEFEEKLVALSDDQGAIFDEFLRRVATIDERSVRFLHMLMPHAPWRYLSDGSQYPHADELPGLEDEVWATDAWASTGGYQRHLVQLQYVDQLLGRLLDQLESQGDFDETLIAITADHGVSFVPGQFRRRITDETFGGVGYVPFFVKAPGQREGEIVDTPLRTVDVFPTVIDHLGVTGLAPTDGGSALDDRKPAESRTVFVNGLNREKFTSSMEPLLATARRKAQLFPDDDTYRFFAAGHNADLLGRSIGDLDVTTDRRLTITITKPDASSFESPNVTEGAVPALASGEVTRAPDVASDDQPTELVVAINGVIAGVSETVRVAGSDRWTALLTPAFFEDDGNTIEILAVSRDGSSVTLLRQRSRVQWART